MVGRFFVSAQVAGRGVIANQRKRHPRAFVPELDESLQSIQPA